jgi:hypothetical protein
MKTPTGMVMAAGAALAAALIGLAPATRADEPDPFQVLFGDSGFNAWTTTADTDLATLSPTLASDFATSVDTYEFDPSNTFTLLADKLDPSAFSDAPDLGGLPDNAIGDFAVGLDYGLYGNGLGSLDFDLGVLLGVFSIYPI